MFNFFFTPQEIQPRNKQSQKLNLTESYDFNLLKQDLFQIVSPHVQSISDQKQKIISWLKKTPFIDRMDILTYTNKEFVCMIRAMYEKKQSEYQDGSSTAFTISYIQETDEFDLLSMVNTKKLSKEYRLAEDELLNNIQIMSRYTQFDSMTFSQNFISNIDTIFHLFQVLGNGISHELTIDHYERLRQLPNSVMFYDPSEEHCCKKASLGTWITEVFMKHISIKYLEYQLVHVNSFPSELKEKIQEFYKYWRLISPERKNQIIKKVLVMKPIDLYQQHRSIIKVTRNGFPPIQRSDKVPNLLKAIINANEKQIFQVLFYTNLNETLESHSVLKFYITLEFEEQIKWYNELHAKFEQVAKMNKKNKKKTAQILKQKQQKPIISLFLKKVKTETNQKQLHQVKISVHNKIQQKNAKQSDKTKSLQSSKVVVDKIKKIEGQKVIVKGTDLFYKKLEVSQTQHIISMEGDLNSSQSKPNQISDPLIQEKSQKKKKKNKKKSKKTSEQVNQISKDVEITKNQDFNSKIQPQNEEDNLQKQKEVLQKSSSKTIDRNSQKSSDTTNDHVDQPKEVGKQPEVKGDSEVKNHPKPDPINMILKGLEPKMSFYNKQRKIVINRLLYVFAQQNLSFKLYGSSLCDVALPSSDVDIVVDSSIVDYFFFSYTNYRKKIINSLEYLQRVFQKFEWASDFLLLPGANIPLLSFNVNTGIDFQFEHGSFEYNNRKELKEEIKISVDVTIEPYINMTDEVPMHLGVESSTLIKDWISTFPFYSQLLSLLKLFTKNHNLNKMYHGGISSFMQAVILAGFYKRFFMDLNVSIHDFDKKREKLEEMLPSECNLTGMLLRYCRFILEFEEDKELIDINSEKKIDLKPSNIPRQQLAIMNPLSGAIMSERCVQFPQYKKVISKLYDKLIQKESLEIDQYLKIVFEA